MGLKPFTSDVSKESSYLNEQYLDNQDYIVLPSNFQIARRVTLFDSNGNEILSNAASTIVSGTKTVVSAGTAVRVTGTSTPIKGVWVNADLIVGIIVTVGDSSVVGNASGMKGLVLTPGNPAIFLAITDLNMLWVDAQINGGRLAFLTVA